MSDLLAVLMGLAGLSVVGAGVVFYRVGRRLRAKRKAIEKKHAQERAEDPSTIRLSMNRSTRIRGYSQSLVDSKGLAKLRDLPYENLNQFVRAYDSILKRLAEIDLHEVTAQQELPLLPDVKEDEVELDVGRTERWAGWRTAVKD